jgi:ubiquitin C-terminal hydrolase
MDVVAAPLEAVAYELVPKEVAPGSFKGRKKYDLIVELLGEGRQRIRGDTEGIGFLQDSVVRFYAREPSSGKTEVHFPKGIYDQLKTECDEKVATLKKQGFGLVSTSTAAKRVTASNIDTPSTMSPGSALKRPAILAYKSLPSASTPPMARAPSILETSPPMKRTRPVDPSEIEIENDEPKNDSRETATEPKFTSPGEFRSRTKPLLFQENNSTLTPKPKTSLDDVFRPQQLRPPIKITTPLTYSSKPSSGSRGVIPMTGGPLKSSNSAITPERIRFNEEKNSNSARFSSSRVPLLRPSSPMVDLEIEGRKKGYPNSGLVCYCNAVVRALVTCEVFERELFSDFWTEALKARNRSFDESRVFEGLRKCFQANRDNVEANPSELIRPYLDSRFRNTLVQHDAHEFLLAVLEKLRIELGGDDVANRENHRLFLSQLMHRVQLRFPNFDVTGCGMNRILPTMRTFEATTVKTITCTSCGVVRNAAAETFLAHSLDFMSERELELPINLEDLLVANMLDETVREVKCERCAEGKHGKVVTHFARVPRVLILHVKRFFNKGGLTGKRQDRVLAPQVLSLSRVLADTVDVPAIPPITAPAPAEALRKAEYELIAGVLHSGMSANSGHYVTIARDPLEDAWFKYDDTKVSSVPAEWTFGEAPQRRAYMYFYRLAHDV